MAPKVRPLKRTNTQIMDAIWDDASPAYQQRIPRATQAGVQETVRTLHKHRPLWNEFTDALINRIGSVIVRNMSWTNPLAEFKRGLLEHGDTIEEIQVGLIKSRVYDPSREYLERDLFGTHAAEVQANFHTVNRREFYPITVNEALLNQAFLNEQGGLTNFVAALLQAPNTSDQWDEFLVTTQLFSEYEANGGFWHVNVPDVRAIGSSEADAKVALRKMRAMADTLKFPSPRYNAARMPTFANSDDLLLFVTPEYNAAIDVEALAGAFNIDKANMHGRIVPVPQENFAIDGVQAIMTTKDFFVIADQLLENTSQWNPVAMQTNYYLHHWQVVSASRFVPAVMFWTGEDDEVIEVRTPVESVSALTVTDADGETVTEVERGGLYAVTGEALTVPEGGHNAAVRWEVEGSTTGRTWISQAGALRVGGDEGAETVTVRATSTWLDPQNVRQAGESNTVAVAVIGDPVIEWPREDDTTEGDGGDPEGQAAGTFAARTTATKDDGKTADKSKTTDKGKTEK